MGERRSSLGGQAAVAAAAAILALCAAGGPLYVSSSASEAVQVQLADGCLADDGMHVWLLADAPHDELDAAARSVAHTAPPVVTTYSQPYLYHPADREAPQLRLVLMHRDGQQDHVGPDTAEPGPGEVILPDWYMRVGGLQVGERLALTVPAPIQYDVANRPLPDQPDPTTMVLSIVGTYPEIPVRPEPPYWCGLRSFFRPSNFGDPPIPVGLVGEATVGSVPFEQIHKDWELRPAPAGITRTELSRLSHDNDKLAALYAASVSVTFRQLRDSDGYTSGAAPVLSYAERLAEVVSRTVAPVRLTGFAAAVALLAAAGVLLARERRRDLRLRLLRGVGPSRLAGLLALAAAPAILLGTTVGAGLAFVAVVVGGPTPELEAGPSVHALVACGIGALAALVIVGVVGASAANRTVDARPRVGRARRLVGPVLVAAIVILTVASYIRLDRAGGVRLVGSEPQGGDLLAQAFPLLAVAAPLILLAWPMIVVLRRARFAGRRLRPALLLGVRRVVMEPPVTVTLVAAIALATGTYVVATALTASAEQTLDDKAATFLGADLVVGTEGLGELPAALADQATIVERASLRSGQYGVDLLGVDRETFARAVRWRHDATSSSLDGVLDQIRSDGSSEPVPAVVVGRALDDDVLRHPQGGEIRVDPVREARSFPGFRNGATLVVVDRDALATKSLGLAEEIWIKSPPAHATDQLVAAGFTVRSPRERADVFEVTSFLTVRWAYGALAAFGLLVAVVVLVAQLLVLDARRGARQVAFVLTRRMGHRAGDEALAVLTELTLPLLAGLALGTALGLAVCRLAVPRLDTLRQLQPSARVVVDTAALVPLAVAAIVAVGLLTMIGVVGVVRARPMEVMRATA